MTVMKSNAHFRALQEFQSARLRRDYGHLAVEQPQYKKLGDFFFDDMYGPHDFQARDRQARRLHQFVHLAPGLTMRDIEVTLDLLDLTNQLDQQVADILVEMNAPIPFSEHIYEDAYYRADAYAPRVRQIEFIREALTRVHQLSQITLLGTALDNTITLARLMGMRELHRFLRKGYQALRVVQNLEPFMVKVETLELVRLDRIYRVE
jgi:hypothetical protein